MKKESSQLPAEDVDELIQQLTLEDLETIAQKLNGYSNQLFDELNKAVNQLERNYYKADPDNFRLINIIKQATNCKTISRYDKLNLSEEVIEMMFADVRQLVLDLANLYVVDGNNALADLFAPITNEFNTLRKNEILFLQQALQKKFISLKEIGASCFEYAMNSEEKKFVESFINSQYADLPEENDIKKSGFFSFYKK